MKSLIFCILIVLLIGCGKQTETITIPIENNKQSCNIYNTEKTTTINCDGEIAVIDNEPISIIDPCGDGKGVDELLLVFEDRVVAWYYDVGMFELEEGIVYVTTDSQRCKFVVKGLEVIEL